MDLLDSLRYVGGERAISSREITRFRLGWASTNILMGDELRDENILDPMMVNWMEILELTPYTGPDSANNTANSKKGHGELGGILKIRCAIAKWTVEEPPRSVPLAE